MNSFFLARFNLIFNRFNVTSHFSWQKPLVLRLNHYSMYRVAYIERIHHFLRVFRNFSNSIWVIALGAELS